MRSDRLFDVIKRLLRDRGLTYAVLGARLEMSESGVKKMFAARDCSVSRLVEIAGVLNVPLEDLVREAEQPAMRRQRLDLDAQKWFLENPLALAVFWKANVERLPVERIAVDLDVSPSEVAAELAKLRALPLDGLEGTAPVRWLEVGPLLDHLNRAWSGQLLADALEEPDESGWLFRLHQLPVRPETLVELHSELEAVCDAAVRRARREASLIPADGRTLARLLVVTRPGSFLSE